MANLAIFVERYTIRRAPELEALTKFKMAAVQMGHTLDFLFRPDLQKIPQYDGLLIRALTDPLNASYIASRSAELHGLHVLDDPASIIICCDKVNMYKHLTNAKVPIPDTRFLRKEHLTAKNAGRLFDELGSPLVLKAPSTSFSTYVERVGSIPEFLEVSKRFLRRADRLVVQRYMPSTFDWRVVTLAGEVLFVCKYIMPRTSWKLQTQENGHTLWAQVEAVDVADVDPGLLEIGKAGSSAIGQGLYGVDIKELHGKFTVIEVNDNPTIDAGYEDKQNPEVYAKIIEYLASGSVSDT